METWLIAVLAAAAGVAALVLLVLLALCLLRMHCRGPTRGSAASRRLDGKVAVVTGASGAGIGKATAEELYRRGAKVILLCRDLERAEEAIRDIKSEDEQRKDGEEARDKGTLEARKVDLASLESVRECASKLMDSEEKINILINNAGTICDERELTPDGLERTFATNHFGPFLLTELLTPLLKAASIREPAHRPRVVVVTTSAHGKGSIKWDDMQYDRKFDSWQCYFDSKLANLLWAKELSRRMESYKVNVYAAHPGMTASAGLLAQMRRSCCGRCCLAPLARRIMRSPFGGAQTSLYCALDDRLESQTGGYYADCREATPDRRALREEDQKRLWRMSVRAVGLPSSAE